MALDTQTASSHDGTTIAYQKQGEGPALILVDGALTVHWSGSGSELAKLLAPHFTVYGFDRRGRGESGETPRPTRSTGKSTTSRR
jgi:pimeloyl-ACP methyl ester carboxylesterase